ncbi:MAG: signal peptidase II [Treponema sp.]|nr:signal peptidase II [Treponema sp.]
MKNTIDKSRQSIAFKLLPLILTIAVIIIDQITKALVVKYIPLTTLFSSEGVIRVAGDYIRIIHVRNKAIAFSLGSSFSFNVRKILFAFAPLIVVIIIFAIYFRNNEFTRLQRWSICGILGGGIGNLIDRFLRPDGVVDFIDCYFFGILGMERWPTFNVADSVVVVCGILFILSFILQIRSDSKKSQENSNE